MQALLDVSSVVVGSGYELNLVFENGEHRVFDMTPYLQKKPFTELQNPAKFALASVSNGTVVWPGNIDIAPETLYDKSRPV